MKKLIVILITIVYSFAIMDSRALKIYQKKYYNEKKVALVIGNGNYEKFPKLPNAINDVRDVKKSLENMGFKVVFGEDLSKKEMRRKLRDFEKLVSRNSVALFYYAGHGLEVDNTNYLVPLRSDIKEKIDVLDEALSLDRVIRGMKTARLKIVVVDACRNDPFSRSLSTNFAPLKAEGTIIAFGTSSGATASENKNDRNGLFTKYFLKTLSTPNLNQVEFFRKIRKEVYENSNHTQKPAIYDETIDDFYFNLNLNIKPIKKSVVSVNNISSKYSLTIMTVPYNAKINITNIKQQYYDGIKLKPGKYNIEITADGYYTKKGYIELKSDTVLNIKLKKMPKSETKLYSLMIMTVPYNAKINITNIKQQYYDGIKLKPGKYNIEITADGYYPKTVYLNLKSDDTIKVKLKKTDKKVWTDPDTGLMWQVDISDNEYGWKGAINYCENLFLDGYNDWRLPTIKELRTISQKNYYASKSDKKKAYIKKPLLKSINKLTYPWFWSSTSYSTFSNKAWLFDFYYGTDYASKKYNNYYVICVKNGE